MKTNAYLTELRKKIPIWIRDISSGDIKGTGIEGIAHKASSRFELSLRTALIQYIDICSLNNKYYAKFPNDIIDKLTLGEVIYRVNFLSDFFKTNYNYCKIAQGRLLPKDILREINDLRKLLEHYPEENEPALIKNTINLLNQIYKIINQPFFNITRK